MLKASLLLFKVHENFKVTFNMFINDDNQKNPNLQLINKFNFQGTDYLKINPYPFLTCDITSRADKKEGWNTNLFFNLNRKDLFKFLQRAQRLYSKFTSVKELFYIDNNSGKLMVSPQLSDHYKEVFKCGDKTLKMQACVVENEEDKQDYEGIFLSINNIDTFTYLTFTELGYLIYELSRVNMSSLSLEVINTVALMRDAETKELPKKQPVQEIKEEEIIDRKVRLTIEDPNTIPEI